MYVPRGDQANKHQCNRTLINKRMWVEEGQVVADPQGPWYWPMESRMDMRVVASEIF